MQRFHQLLFTATLLALSWYFMMAVHELGHVLGAIATGGQVERVVLHPFSISRTDVSPNPHPAIVVWLGPLVGICLPLALAIATWRLPTPAHRSLLFVAGFCLIANGGYISFGSFDGIGDCGEMLRTGTPLWVMHLFGITTVTAGLYIWHKLGTVKQFWDNPNSISPTPTYLLTFALIALLAAEFTLSPQ